MRPLRVHPNWTSAPPTGTISARFFSPDSIHVRRAEEILDPLHFVDLPDSVRRALGTTAIHLPPHFIAKLRNCRVFSHHGVVISPENRVFHDLTHEFRPFQLGNRVCHYAGLPPIEHLDARVLVIPTVSCWKNYFHWMVDAVPRLRAVDPDEYDFVLTPLSRPYHRDVLDALHIPEAKRLEATADTHLQVSQLIVPNYPTPGHPSPEAIQFVKQAILAQLPPQPTAIPPSKRLYISRGDAWRRRVRNEVDLMDLLEPFGFEMITMEGLSLLDQANLFRQLDVVISPHGAALTNLIFSAPGTRILECYPSDFIYPHFYRLAAAAGQIYSAHTSHCELEDPDFDLDLDTLKPSLHRLLNHPSD